nr:hypothetical protein Hi04_10k_c5202_00005 [uncultured bacterium]
MANESAKTASGQHGAGEHHPTSGFYIFIWVVLLALTFLTVGVNQLFHLPKAVHMPSALLIAATKATLVALFFMHLRYSSGATRMTLIISVGFVVILMLGILADIYTRYPLTNPNESDLSGVADRTLRSREAYGPEIQDFSHEGHH